MEGVQVRERKAEVSAYHKDVPVIVHVWVHGNHHYQGLSQRFLDSYRNNSPEYNHASIVTMNGGDMTFEQKWDFRTTLPLCSFHRYNNEAYDIGAFLDVSKTLQHECAMYFGSASWFIGKGWLARMMQVWKKYGPGLYGTMGSFEESPHLCSSGFMTSPDLMRRYPHLVDNIPKRWLFEHSPIAFIWFVESLGFPVKLVTWDAEYDWPDFRKPGNGVFKGDQRDCLTGMRHSWDFLRWPKETQIATTQRADTLVHPEYIQRIREGKVPK